MSLAAISAIAPVVSSARGEGAAAEGVLVLRNGNVLEGAVRRHGDSYRIELADAVLQVPAAQVEMFCRSLDEAYESRRHHRVGSSVDARLELARWCLQHGLLDQAAREILDARTIDPRHPALASLELRLGQMLEFRANRRQRPHSAASPHAPALPENDQADSPLETPEVSLEVQAQFVRSIQPMLIHNCAAGGCHQPGTSQQMQLDRWALHGSGNVMLIRRNLAAVLAQIDGDDPPSSPLIRWARRPHGSNASKPSRPLASYQSALLLDWLNQATGANPADAAGAGRDVDEQGGTLDELASAESDREGATLESPPKATFTPRDRFDPEIFNRRRAARHKDGDVRPASIEAASAAPHGRGETTAPTPPAAD